MIGEVDIQWWCAWKLTTQKNKTTLDKGSYITLSKIQYT